MGEHAGVLLLPCSETECSEPACRVQQLSAASSASGNTLLKTHTPGPEPGGPLQTVRQTGREEVQTNKHY